jgi:hypothetical protein
MDVDSTLRLLEQLAERLGVEVRYEAMGESRGVSAGGLCRLRDRAVLLVDAGAPPAEQVGVLLDALCELDTESVFVPPAIRRELARRRR